MPNPPSPSPSPSPSPASFWAQANALLRKNLTYQKRNMKTNIRLILFPVILCVLLVVLQHFVDKLTNNNDDETKCGGGCSSICANEECSKGGDDHNNNNNNNINGCGSLQHVTISGFNKVPSCAVTDPPEWPPLLQLLSSSPSCTRTNNNASSSCPLTILFTASNFSFAQSLYGNMFASPFSLNLSDIMASLATNVLGSEVMLGSDNFLEPAFFLEDRPIYYLQNQCTQNSSLFFPFKIGATNMQKEVKCVQCLRLWRNSASEINNELYKGYQRGNKEEQNDQIVTAFDLLNSNSNRLNVSIWYNSTNKESSDDSGPPKLVRVPRSVNLVVLTSLVYEKEQKLRIMMKMHGLSDGPYWMISYAYFLAISVIYMLCFVIFGSLLVTAYIVVFGTGLLAGVMFQDFLTSTSFPREWIIIMELYPGFALYRGLFEFAQYAFVGDGMRWDDLSDSNNGMKEVLIIMFVEWIVVLFVAYCIDHGRSPLSFLKGSQKKHSSSTRKPSIRKQQDNALVHLEKPDIIQEREKVEQLVHEPTINHAIVCDNLKKVYPGRDGNSENIAVRGLSLVVPQGECFGMLGPNGAGKTSFISMMIGLTKPTSGTAYVQGQDIRTQMNGIYTTMGVCPQHNLLWECLTGREHLLFYGRLKNLKGSALTQAVEESLKSLNIFHGGVADKRAGSYSGGMKRRLSVAISLIGDPRVVYMDEPSTGLDPASRNSLWNVVKHAKKDRAIILTTHSMEEAEVLCDRLGIFVNGSLQCVGNPKELKSRYGGTYVFTITTPSDNEKDVENMVLQLSPNANKIYHLSGTQKFELPKEEVRIATVFRAVENAKRHFTVSAWGLADTTMEDVFIKVAHGAQESIALS
ncbi:hypothetical protein RIF29_08001 [Crotalaria pallida]|uniref:ABC transporter domain-containing protein n=1 Tax=Crotalaria pallida TaxID=3830 RepID=A0AAN9J4Q6_CROPI